MYSTYKYNYKNCGYVLGSACAHCSYWRLSSGEPSPPKLEGTPQSKGNAVKVKWIKQDDGGSPITHYLIRYKAVSI